MSFFSRLFSINTIILVFAIAIIPFAISQFVDVFRGASQLKRHVGVLEDKIIVNDSSRSPQRRVIKLKLLNDTTVYTVSKYVDRVNNLIELNDSVELYTKGLVSRFGNFVIDEKGSGWTTRNGNEIFHLTTNRYDTPVIDFKEYQAKHRLLVWGWPIMSLLFFAWYFYRRSGLKSPFISES